MGQMSVLVLSLFCVLSTLLAVEGATPLSTCTIASPCAYEQGSNWIPNGIPTSGTDVTLTDNQAVTIIDARSVSSFTFEPTTALGCAVVFAGTGALTVSSTTGFGRGPTFANPAFPVNIIASSTYAAATATAPTLKLSGATTPFHADGGITFQGLSTVTASGSAFPTLYVQLDGDIVWGATAESNVTLSGDVSLAAADGAQSASCSLGPCRFIVAIGAHTPRSALALGAPPTSQEQVHLYLPYEWGSAANHQIHVVSSTYAIIALNSATATNLFAGTMFIANGASAALAVYSIGYTMSHHISLDGTLSYTQGINSGTSTITAGVNARLILNGATLASTTVLPAVLALGGPAVGSQTDIFSPRTFTATNPFTNIDGDLVLSGTSGTIFGSVQVSSTGTITASNAPVTIVGGTIAGTMRNVVGQQPFYLVGVTLTSTAIFNSAFPTPLLFFSGTLTTGLQAPTTLKLTITANSTLGSFKTSSPYAGLVLQRGAFVTYTSDAGSHSITTVTLNAPCGINSLSPTRQLALTVTNLGANFTFAASGSIHLSGFYLDAANSGNNVVVTTVSSAGATSEFVFTRGAQLLVAAAAVITCPSCPSSGGDATGVSLLFQAGDVNVNSLLMFKGANTFSITGYSVAPTVTVAMCLYKPLAPGPLPVGVGWTQPNYCNLTHISSSALPLSSSALPLSSSAPRLSSSALPLSSSALPLSSSAVGPVSSSSAVVTPNPVSSSSAVPNPVSSSSGVAAPAQPSSSAAAAAPVSSSADAAPAPSSSAEAVVPPSSSAADAPISSSAAAVQPPSSSAAVAPAPSSSAAVAPAGASSSTGASAPNAGPSSSAGNTPSGSTGIAEPPLAAGAIRLYFYFAGDMTTLFNATGNNTLAAFHAALKDRLHTLYNVPADRFLVQQTDPWTYASAPTVGFRVIVDVQPPTAGTDQPTATTIVTAILANPPSGAIGNLPFSDQQPLQRLCPDGMTSVSGTAACPSTSGGGDTKPNIKLSDAAIIGIIAGCAFFLLVIIGVVACAPKKRNPINTYGGVSNVAALSVGGGAVDSHSIVIAQPIVPAATPAAVGVELQPLSASPAPVAAAAGGDLYHSGAVTYAPAPAVATPHVNQPEVNYHTGGGSTVANPNYAMTYATAPSPVAVNSDLFTPPPPPPS